MFDLDGVAADAEQHGEGFGAAAIPDEGSVCILGDPEHVTVEQVVVGAAHRDEVGGVVVATVAAVPDMVQVEVAVVATAGDLALSAVAHQHRPADSGGNRSGYVSSMVVFRVSLDHLSIAFHQGPSLLRHLVASAAALGPGAITLGAAVLDDAVLLAVRVLSASGSYHVVLVSAFEFAFGEHQEQLAGGEIGVAEAGAEADGGPGILEELELLGLLPGRLFAGDAVNGQVFQLPAGFLCCELEPLFLGLGGCSPGDDPHLRPAQGTAGGDLYSHAIKIYGAEAVGVDAIWLHVHTADAFGLRAMYSNEIQVSHLIVVSEVEQVTDRHYPGNRGISLDLSPEDAEGLVEESVLFGVPHWGIMITADDPLDSDPGEVEPLRVIRNNHVFADMHATNGYALGLHANHLEADHNEIRPLYNGRAVHVTRSDAHVHHNIIEALERVHGDEAQGFSNYTDIADEHSPHDASVCSWVVAHGIRVEGGNFGEIDHNEVYTYSLPDVTFGATAFNLNCEGSSGAGNEVHHNQFTAEEAPGSLQCGGGLPILAGWVRGDPPTVVNDLHDNVFRSTGDTLLIEDPSLATSTNDDEVPL